MNINYELCIIRNGKLIGFVPVAAVDIPDRVSALARKRGGLEGTASLRYTSTLQWDFYGRRGHYVVKAVRVLRDVPNAPYIAVIKRQMEATS